MHNKVLVFSGPTLTATQAKQILPEAEYLPPVKCGDVLQVLRFQPQALVIIDGLFETTAAVWHKEIMTALQHNIPVYGCSSMGAMRAAELESFGMQGYGEVFHYYRDNFISDDDEVAVLHLNEENDYLPITEAMINIRANCEIALKQNIISNDLFELVITVAKKSFYHQRTIPNLLQLCLQTSADQTAVIKFFDWYKVNKIDLKKADAIALLTQLKTEELQLKAGDFLFNQTSFMVCLYNTFAIAPFYHYTEVLPVYEKKLMAARLLHEIYNLNKYFAKFLPALMCLVNTAAVAANSKSAIKLEVPEEIPLNLRDAYQKSISQIAPLIVLETFDEQHPAAKYFYDFLRIAFQYVNLKQMAQQQNYHSIIDYLKHTDRKKFNMLAFVALAWQQVDHHLEIMQLEPTFAAINNYIQTFRIAHNFLQLTELEAWLDINDLSKDQYVEFVKKIIRYDHVIKGSNFEIFNVKPKINGNDFWLLFALLFTDTYQDITLLLTDPVKIQQNFEILQQKALTNPQYKADVEALEKFIHLL